MCSFSCFPAAAKDHNDTSLETTLALLTFNARNPSIDSLKALKAWPFFLSLFPNLWSFVQSGRHQESIALCRGGPQSRMRTLVKGPSRVIVAAAISEWVLFSKECGGGSRMRANRSPNDTLTVRINPLFFTPARMDLSHAIDQPTPQGALPPAQWAQRAATVRSQLIATLPKYPQSRFVSQAHVLTCIVVAGGLNDALEYIAKMVPGKVNRAQEYAERMPCHLCSVLICMRENTGPHFFGLSARFCRGRGLVFSVRWRILRALEYRHKLERTGS